MMLRQGAVSCLPHLQRKWGRWHAQRDGGGGSAISRTRDPLRHATKTSRATSPSRKATEGGKKRLRTCSGFGGKAGDYGIEHAFEVIVDVGVPETDDSPASAFKGVTSSFVVAAVFDRAMCCAVELDGEFQRDDGEIDDVRADRMLGAKVPATELTCLEAGPEDKFGIRELAPQGFCPPARLPVLFQRETPSVSKPPPVCDVARREFKRHA